MMFRKQSGDYAISYKTGWDLLSNGEDLAWIVGWIEKNKAVQFFVLNLQGRLGNNLRPVREKLLYDIFNHLGINIR